MPVKLFAILVAVLVSILGVSNASALDDYEDSQTINQMTQALSLGDVDKLEKLGEEIIATKSRNSTGKWKLEAFHEAFEMFLMNGKQIDVLEKVFAKWEAAYPLSKVALVAHASVLTDYAWLFRGGSYSDNVWKDDWSKFFDNLKQAHALLEKSKPAASENPRWYATMVCVEGALEFPKKLVLATAREGMSKHPGYGAIPRSAMIYLMPKWGGSVRMVRAWIEEASLAAKSVEGDGLYARMAWDVLGSNEGFATYSRAMNWERLKKAADDRTLRYTDMANKRAALNTACRFRDVEEVKKRYIIIAKAQGPSMDQTIDPAVYCKWPQSKAPIPGVIDPSSLPRSDAPVKTRAQ